MEVAAAAGAGFQAGLDDDLLARQVRRQMAAIARRLRVFAALKAVSVFSSFASSAATAVSPYTDAQCAISGSSL